MPKEIKIIFAYFIVLATLLFGATMVFADCTGCGDDGHQAVSYTHLRAHET